MKITEINDETEYKIVNDDSEDYFVLKGNLEEVRKIAREEVERRGWKNVHSEVI